MKLYEKKTLTREMYNFGNGGGPKQILTFYYILGFCVYIHEGPWR